MTCLCKLLDSLLGFLLDGGEELLLLVGKLLLYVLLELLDSLLDVGEFLFLALADGLGPGGSLLLLLLGFCLEFLDHALVSLLSLFLCSGKLGTCGIGFVSELDQFSEVDVSELGLRSCSHCKESHCGD